MFTFRPYFDLRLKCRSRKGLKIADILRYVFQETGPFVPRPNLFRWVGDRTTNSFILTVQSESIK